MKILLGILIGAGLVLGTHVYAESSYSIIKVGSITVDGAPINKVYDYNNGVVCYTYGFSSGGISCFHN